MGGLHTLVCGRNRHPGVPSPPAGPGSPPATWQRGDASHASAVGLAPPLQIHHIPRLALSSCRRRRWCDETSPGVNHPGPPRPCKCATATTLLAAMPCCLVAASWRQLFSPRVPLASLPSSSRSPRPSLIVIPDNKDLFRRAATMHRRIAMRGAARRGMDIREACQSRMPVALPKALPLARVSTLASPSVENQVLGALQGGRQQFAANGFTLRPREMGGKWDLGSASDTSCTYAPK